MSDIKVEGIIKVPNEVISAAISDPESEEAKVIRELYEKTKDFLGSGDVSNESVKDRKKVHQLLQNLTEKLVEIEGEK